MYIIEVIVMRRDRNPFLIIAIIILSVIVVGALVRGALLRLPQYPEYFRERIINSTDQDTIKEIKVHNSLGFDVPTGISLPFGGLLVLVGLGVIYMLRGNEGEINSPPLNERENEEE